MTDTQMRPEDYGTQYLDQPARPEDHFPPDVAFGTGATQVVPHEWAAWILTEMRNQELAGSKPKVFSAWLAACVMANR